MTESMNLDSADIVGSLEGFDATLSTSLDADFDMLNHDEEMSVNEMGIHEEEISVNEMDIHEEEISVNEIDIGPLTNDGVHVQEEITKEEIVENMEEITEEQLLEETIPYEDENISSHDIESVMDIVDDNRSYNEVENSLIEEHETSEIQNDNDIFSADVINEEIVSEQVIIGSEPQIYEGVESNNDFQDINDMLQDNIGKEETVVNEPEVQSIECKPDIVQNNKYDSDRMSPDVYIVQPHVTNFNQHPIHQIKPVIAPKENKVTRVVMPASDTGQPPTIKIVAPQGKLVGSTSKTITLAQAKQMGLLNQIIPASSKGGVGKLVVPKKTVTVMKSPTKILPAPPARNQKIVIRGAGGSLKAGTIVTQSSPGVIRIPASQAAQFHLQSSNKQVQYVKLVGTGKAGGVQTLVPVQTLSTKTIPVALQTSLIGSQTFKVVPFTTQATAGQPQATTVTGAQRVLIPASTAAQVVSSATVVPPPQQAQKHSIVMIQPQIIPQIKDEPAEETVKTTEADPMITVKEEVIVKSDAKSESGDVDVVEANGIRPRKPCNCTKSLCLKLYCDCFANGEFCHQCNCTTCYNNLSHEEERQRAIKSCLERNPSAFRPKIGKTYIGSEERRHNKGCNCRRSGCLKNYCECYEAKIPCSKNCKCIGCKNTEALLKRGLTCDDIDKLTYRDKSDSMCPSPYDSMPAHRQALNMMSPQLVEATCQCLVAQVDDWSRGGSTDIELAQAIVIEELGRCLAQLIECINKTLPQISQSAS